MLTKLLKRRDCNHNISPYSINQMHIWLIFNIIHLCHMLCNHGEESYDDGDITPTNEIMEAKNETSSGGGTLPRQQRQTKRSVTPTQICDTKLPTNDVSTSNVTTTATTCIWKLYAGQTHQTQAEVHVEHSQVEVCMSNSSIDSIDQIPFANENAGTIKQRALNRHDLPQSASSSSTSSSNSSASTAIPLCSSGARVTSPATTECDTNLDDPDDSDTVFNDINIMLNKLNGEIDIMIEHGANGENNGEN
ncbi:hypothetical protein PVAND_016699 [Polypedilum vanderplanki]|uniref:Uncharacterized protein n=1 Tax=Polypedilum vanderplanki TaxID=319348 RepID=A0A9J6BFW3_POLVA|nr:hypothetical protein PVAND_016699 [Polypedilum vanderplanki]